MMFMMFLAPPPHRRVFAIAFASLLLIGLGVASLVGR